MPKFVFTKGTTILLLATIIFLISVIIHIIYALYAFLYLMVALNIFSGLATYAASIRMSYSVYGDEAGSVRYLGETSAVSLFCLITVGMAALDLFIRVLIYVTPPLPGGYIPGNIFLIAFLLMLTGFILAIIGGIIGHGEW